MNKPKYPPLFSSIGVRLTLAIGVIVSLTIILLFIGIYQNEKEQHLKQLHAQAEALLSEMTLTRSWVASYNGVWTKTPGDFYLDSKDGYYQKSPAMVTKELSLLSNESGEYRFHITSLHLTNPDNAPNHFEHDALVQFEEDFAPIAAIDRTGAEPVYRLMIPLAVKASCLECHADQGYQVDDVRGGLSVIISTAEMDASLQQSRRMLTFSAIGIVGLVMVTLYVMVRKMIILPVGELKNVAIAVGEGNYETQSHLQTGDELEVFGKTLNKMVGNLKASQNSLQERIVQRTHELDTISEIALILSRAGELESVLTEALEKVIGISGADGGFVQVFQADNKTRILSHLGLTASIVQCFGDVELEYAPAPMQNPVEVQDVHVEVCRTLYPGHRCLAKDGCGANQEGYTRASSVLLRSRSRSVGKLVLFSKKPASFPPELMQLLESIGNQLGVAIENAIYHQQIEQIVVLEERTRISRELHDSLAQTLGWLSIKTELLEEDLNEGEIERSSAEIKEIRNVVRDACYDVRESIDGLRTQPTGNFSVTATAWVAEFRQRSGLEANFHARNAERQLPSLVESELLRILQEALTNVRKHANAKHVEIHLDIQDDLVTLQIKDDGDGFVYDPEERTRHFGLRIMRERAEGQGGSFDVHSLLEEGTTVFAELPLHPKNRFTL